MLFEYFWLLIVLLNIGLLSIGVGSGILWSITFPFSQHISSFSFGKQIALPCRHLLVYSPLVVFVTQYNARLLFVLYEENLIQDMHFGWQEFFHCAYHNVVASSPMLPRGFLMIVLFGQVVDVHDHEWFLLHEVVGLNPDFWISKFTASFCTCLIALLIKSPMFLISKLAFPFCMCLVAL